MSRLDDEHTGTRIADQRTYDVGQASGPGIVIHQHTVCPAKRR
ncbi:hypothetical protein [Streptomyces sp. A3M-1-3]|nr:hypothetical protein [Streptomyces sp. A3M-1-3]